MAKQKVALGKRPCVLIIRDGWGHNPDPSEDLNNAIEQADTPVDDALAREYPHCLIHTHGAHVGLPDGVAGNSAVGHQNIGAGRVVPQESARITLAIRDGSFFENKELMNLVRFVNTHNGRMHIMGLCSDRSVHSRIEHLYALLALCRQNSLTEVFLHAFTDGRDTPPESGIEYLAAIERKAAEIGVGRIATVMGRCYAMDRAGCWEHVRKAYECLTGGAGRTAGSPAAALKDSYERAVGDEFVEPTCIVNESRRPIATVADGDGVVFFNFREDRARQLTQAFVDPGFEAFPRATKPDVHFVCMTEYDAAIPAAVAFPRRPRMKNTLGAYWSSLGLRQFRCAETAKYAHVTFFFNDCTDRPFKGEHRQIVPSPSVGTYDLKPEMSAYEVTDVVLERLDSDRYDVLVVNFANPDMVGHTGDLSAAIRAAEVVDACVGKVLEKVKTMGGAAIVTADHGNFEKMVDGASKSPHRSHTVGDVPLIVFDDRYKGTTLREGGTLADIGPTLLEMMGLAQPKEMTGRSLLTGANTNVS